MDALHEVCFSRDGPFMLNNCVTKRGVWDGVEVVCQVDSQYSSLRDSLIGFVFPVPKKLFRLLFKINYCSLITLGFSKGYVLAGPLSFAQHSHQCENRFQHRVGKKVRLTSWDRKRRDFVMCRIDLPGDGLVRTCRLSETALKDEDKVCFRDGWVKNEKVVVDYGGPGSFEAPFVCRCLTCMLDC